MSDPAEQHRGSPEDLASQAAEDALGELARLRAAVERLMQERVTPALAGATRQAERGAEREREAVEHQPGAAIALGGASGAFDDAMDGLMSGFDERLAELNRRLDRVLERRR